VASISFKNVSKSFGDTVALDDVSFDVAHNEFFCLFGPPLSGKSTILKIILGLEMPDEGEVLIDGERVNHVSPADRNVAMVFQNLALFPHMSAKENVCFPLMERRIDPEIIAVRLAEVAAKLHIGHILDKPPSQLSGGERQRVAIARALVRDPVAYLMDDPISALDARLREQTRVELRRIQQEMGQTLIYVTHDQEEAMSVADRMLILKDGKVRQIGKPVELYDQPNSTYVAQMLGAPAINILPSAWASKNAGVSQTDAAKVGVRPEDFKIETADHKTGTDILEVETLGAFTTITVAGPDAPVKIALRGQAELNVGDRIRLSADPKQTLLFDEAGEALTTAA